MKRHRAHVGSLELELMQVIWRSGAGTVAGIRAALSRPLAYTTVQTVLNILHRKGKLQRNLKGRAYTYSAKVSEKQSAIEVLRDLIDRRCYGSGEELMMRLIEINYVDQKQIGKLQQLIRQESTTCPCKEQQTSLPHS